MAHARAVALPTAVLLALLVASTPRAGEARSSRALDMSVTVTAKDYSFSLSEKTSAVGKVTFSVKNSGKKDHSFQIAGKKTSVLKPGKSAKLTVSLGKAGSFTYQSTVGDDAKKGHEGHVHGQGRVRREEGLHLDRLRRVPRDEGRRHDRHGRAEPRQVEGLAGDDRERRHQGQGR